MSTDHPQLSAKMSRVMINTRIGIHSHEHNRTQRLCVSCEIGFVPRRWPAIDIGDVYDYDALYRFVTQTIPMDPHIELIETLIEKLLAFVFLDDCVRDVRIDLAQPDILPFCSGVGVAAHWTRDAWLKSQRPSAIMPERVVIVAEE